MDGSGKKRVAQDTTLVTDLLALIEPDARGDPMSPLCWTCKSLSQLTRALVAKGHRVGRTLVGELLHQQKFSLQANRKTREAESHPDRNAQFTPSQRGVRAALAAKRAGDLGGYQEKGACRRPSGQARGHASRMPAAHGVLRANPRCMTS